MSDVINFCIFVFAHWHFVLAQIFKYLALIILQPYVEFICLGICLRLLRPPEEGKNWYSICHIL